MEAGYALRHSAENHLRDESILTFFLLECYNIVGRTISMRRPFSVMGTYLGNSAHRCFIGKEK